MSFIDGTGLDQYDFGKRFMISKLGSGIQFDPFSKLTRKRPV
jgi:hypothetical protein